MRTTSLILGLLLIHLGQAVKFSGVKVKLGKAKCTCDITVVPTEPCTGKTKCDKKCSGKGGVELDGFTIDLLCRKGKCTVSNCEAEGTEAPTGSGSEPGPLPGSGSEPPMPITGSGMPPTGSSMPCSCQCSCPAGGAACDCDCNC